jgi:hypothetical protein
MLAGGKLLAHRGSNVCSAWEITGLDLAVYYGAELNQTPTVGFKFHTFTLLGSLSKFYL